ncbi:DUF1559 domain-containing protein [Blastopirellula sp. J2-11]|nr:DUF1559 domain-containing protein [Blastopirellula sp. J2-11]
MKQIGLSLHNVHDVHGRFPPGSLSLDGTRWGNKEWPNFLHFCLPYLEQTAYHDRLNDYQNAMAWNVSSSHAQWGPLHDLPIDGLTCPSAIGGSTKEVKGGLRLAATNYLGIFSGLNDGQSAADTDAQQRGLFAMTTEKKARRMADVTDGLSNTIVVAEYITGTQTDVRGCFITARAGCQFLQAKNTPNSSAPDELYSYASPKFCPDNDPFCTAVANNDTNHASSRSRHPSGVNVLNGDGSVHFVSESVALTIWQSSAWISDGEVVPGSL